MTEFGKVLPDDVNPYAGKDANGNWLSGTIDIDFLQQQFGHLSTALEMQAATDSEGLRLYFGWLAEQGILPA